MRRINLDSLSGRGFFGAGAVEPEITSIVEGLPLQIIVPKKVDQAEVEAAVAVRYPGAIAHRVTSRTRMNLEGGGVLS